MIRNITILICSSLLIAFLWSIGLEKVYAHVVTFSTNAVVGIGSKQTNIKLEEQENELIFNVTTIVEGRKGSYPQKAQTLLLPTVMIFAWQLMLFFGIPWRNALKTSGFNLLLFLSFHVIFLLLLTAYYNSQAAKFFFHLMMETFYILALLIIIKDSIKYPQIWVRR